MPGLPGHKGKLMSFVSKTYAIISSLAALSFLGAPPASAQSPDLKSPKGVAGFYSSVLQNAFSNGTGNFSFIIWKGDSSGADTARGGGYRVRRTIFGVSNRNLEQIGQFTTRFQQAPICWGTMSPCVGYFYNFTGTGLYFRGFQQNKRADGTFVVDYPPGAPQDTCSDCWVFADGASLSGFRHEYAVTTIDTTVVINSDFYETPIDSTQLVYLTPGSPPKENLEDVVVVPNPFRVRAEWDPADGSHQVKFIRVPDRSTVRIFTSAGELLKTLTANQYQSPGGLTGDVTWDLKNDSGNLVVSGIYLFQVETVDGRTIKGKFVIIK
jgi:hypothetical protein